MEKITRVEVNCSTGETSIIELTEAEIADLKTAQAKAEADRKAQEAEAEAKALEKAALLERLGLTEAEAALLLS